MTHVIERRRNGTTALQKYSFSGIMCGRDVTDILRGRGSIYLARRWFISMREVYF